MKSIALLLFLCARVAGAQEQSVAYPWPSTSPAPLTTEWVNATDRQTSAVEAELAKEEAEAKPLLLEAAEVQGKNLLRLPLAFLSAGKGSRIKGQREQAQKLAPRLRALFDRTASKKIRWLTNGEARTRLSDVDRLAGRYDQVLRDLSYALGECIKATH